MSDTDPIVIEQPIVQIRWIWGEAWSPIAYLRPLEVKCSVGASSSTASFEWIYGVIDDADGGGYGLREPWAAGLDGVFVRIAKPPRIELGEDLATPIWHGVITGDDETLGSDEKTEPTGQQTLRARGLEHLLDTARVDGSYVKLAASDPVQIDTVLPFNLRHRDGISLAGNRSADRYASPSGASAYVFSEDGEVWTARDVAEYLLAWFGPGLMAAAPLDGLDANLNVIKQHFGAPRTVADGLKAVIDRRRGHSWRVIVDASDKLVVWVSSVFDKEIDVKGVKISPAAVRVSLLQSPPASLTVQRTGEEYFNRIVVRGDPIIICGTVKLSDSRLKPAWSDDQAAAYINADALGRAADAYGHVFTAYRVDTDEINTGPTCNADGTLDGDSQANLFPLGKSLLRQLPFRVDSDDEEAPAEYRAPFVAALTAVAGEDKYVKLSEPPESLSAAGFPTMGLRMLDGEMGLQILTTHKHLLALNHFDGGETYGWAPAVDYDDLVATVAWASDEYLTVTVDVPGGRSNRPRTLTIDVPGAQAWWVLPNTAGDVVDGALETAAAGQIRDDADKLRAVAAMAKAWYQRDRQAITAVYRELIYSLAPGDLVERINSAYGGEEVNTPITSIVWDFAQATTKIQTDFVELNFRSLVGEIGYGGAMRVPRLSASLGVDHLSALHDVDKRGNLPVRLPEGGALPGRLFMVKVSEDGTGAAGNKTTQCTFTYNVYDAVDVDIILGTGMSPIKRRPATGKMSAGPTKTYGTAFYEGSTLKLYDANETLASKSCDP